MSTGLLRAAKRKLLRPVTKRVAGVRVRYHSKSTGLSYDTGADGEPLIATMANSAAEAETVEGIQFTEQIKDWKIDTVDLPVFPQSGDRIEVLKDDRGIEMLGLAGQWYQVLSDGASRASEPGDNHEDWYLIHSKNIPAEVAPAPAFGNAAGDAFGNAQGDIYAGPSD